MTSNRVFMGIMFALVVVGMTLAVCAQTGPGRLVTFDEPVRVQGQTLPAGNYHVDHVMDGSKHIMVFKQDAGPHQEFRLNCDLRQLPAKAKQTTKIFDTSSGTRVLKAMTFMGDTYEHVFGE